MAECALAEEAESDLLDIARYTVDTWGFDQAERYLAALNNHFMTIGCGDVAGKPVFEHRDDLFVSRCEHHFVFFSRESAVRVLILAVLHEKMDLMARLRDRLDAGGNE